MSIRHLKSTSELQAELAKAGGKLLVVDYSATWCGPCKAITPVYEELARSHPDVLFFKVMENEAGEMISEQGVRGFPTFHFYLKKEKVDEAVGADAEGLRRKVEAWKAKAQPAFGGAGTTLGGHGGAKSSEEVARARLRALAGSGAVSAPAPAPVAAPVTAPVATTTAPSADVSNTMHQIATHRAHGGVAHKDAAYAFNPQPELLVSLLEMGMSRERSYRALRAVNNSSVEAALDWLTEHQEDAGMDDPIPHFSEHGAGEHAAGADTTATATTTVTATEITAEDNDAIQQAEALLNAENVAGAPKKKLTKEEVDELLRKRRAEKALKEKEDARLREIKRRADGKASLELVDEILDIQKKREADRIRMEKEMKDKERHRLQVELLRDKIERHQKLHGTVPHELMEQLASMEGLKKAPVAEVPTDPRAAVKQSLVALSAYKAGMGLTAAQTLRTLINNPLLNPTETKYRSINLENAKIKERVTTLRGGLTLLKAAGFVKDDEARAMQLTDEHYNSDLLKMAVEEIDAAVTGGLFE